MQLSRFAAFTDIYSNESRCSEMLAAGAAVGVASTFSAPVGGVLLSIELTSVLFAVRNYWRSFYAASCSALVILIVLPTINDPLLDIQPQYQTRFPPGKSFSVQELPLFALLGIIIGLMSVLFIKFHRFWVIFLRRNRVCKKVFQANFFVYPIVISALVGTVTYPESLGQFMAGKKKFITTLIDFYATCTWSNVEGATVCNESITDNYTGLHHDVSIFVSLSVFILIHFFLSILCHTMPIPSGIIISCLGMGAATGRLMGEIFSVINDGFVWTGAVHQAIYPGVYAVAGSAAMVGSVTHTVSTAVIMFEMTGQLLHLLPVLIAVIVSNAVCSFFEISIIDSVIQLRKLPYLPDLSRGSSIFHSITVSQFMISPVLSIHKRSSYREVRELLKTSPKISAFPIVDSKESLLLLGTVDRRKLERFINERVRRFSSPSSSSLSFLSFSSPFHIFSFRRMLHSWRKDETETVSSPSPSHPLFLLPLISVIDSINLDERINVDSLSIDETPIQVTSRTSLFKIHWLFSLLSVNRIFITERGALRGVVALKEVREAIEAVHNGDLKPNQDPSYHPLLAPPSFLSSRKVDEDNESDCEEDQLQGRLEIIRGLAFTEDVSQSNVSLRSADPRLFAQSHSKRMDHMTRERRYSINISMLARRNIRKGEYADRII
ncbi:hypothetical protein PENTCL1PPCAC_17700 [Pristionchus entomophagus]|uniref:Chloride channel protein n=1 Tax=Pristionchus entomophagus TaxID=358040 RepID=A0AAV5TM66_9BILA|nr:hypothetical protein PENTCL1PPCAC_17700 [Pristionchus entomophagus]